VHKGFGCNGNLIYFKGILVNLGCNQIFFGVSVAKITIDIFLTYVLAAVVTMFLELFGYYFQCKASAVY
jgi:hypothetical protein